MTEKQRQQQEKREKRLAQERARVAAMRAFERETAAGIPDDGLLCGIDEAGRGPLAGPVSAGAVILPPDHDLLYLNDSKKLSASRRESLYDEITREAVAWAVVFVSPERIDEINILQATYEAMRGAVREVCSQLEARKADMEAQGIPGAAEAPEAPAGLLNDAVRIPGIAIPQFPVVKGDAKCLSIAAASILAKVTRDRYMEEMDEKFPVYGFARHKGYGTKEHMEAIRACGPCPIHRRTFIKGITG